MVGAVAAVTIAAAVKRRRNAITAAMKGDTAAPESAAMKRRATAVMEAASTTVEATAAVKAASSAMKAAAMSAANLRGQTFGRCFRHRRRAGARQ
jgi:hypothetical protein